MHLLRNISDVVTMQQKFIALIAILAVVLLIGITYNFQAVTLCYNLTGSVGDSICNPLSKVSKDNLHRAFTLTHRNEIGDYLHYLNFKTGAELGVKTGEYSKELLSRWLCAQTFYLVDAWQQQKLYVDIANVADSEQQKYFEATRELLKPWANKTVFLRMFIHEAAKKIDDNSVDFVYVDARHDYCGVKQDLEDFWPKVKVGGIMAGHDYVYAINDGTKNWGICADGSFSPLGVKGAVHEFAAKYCVYVQQDPVLQQVLRVRHHFTGPDIDPNNFANEAKLLQYEKYSKKFKFEDSVERGLLNRANATNGFLYDFEVADAHNFTEKVDSDEIVYLILGCRNWSYKMKSQLRTWLSFIKHYFFATDAETEDIPNAVVLDRSFHGATATYISAGERHWNSMLWLNEEKSDLLAKLKWIVLVDDDTWMNIPKLLEFLSSYNYKHNIAIGQVFHELFTKNRTFLQGGSGIVLSRTAFYAVTDKLFKPACRYNLHGDLSLWSCYKVAGTLLIHSDMFYHWSVTYDNLKNYHVFMPHRYVNEISFHYMSNHFVSMKMTCDVAQYWEHQEPFGCKEMRRVTNNSFYLKQPHLLSLRYSYY